MSQPNVIYKSKLADWVCHSLMASAIKLLVQIVFADVNMTPTMSFLSSGHLFEYFS